MFECFHCLSRSIIWDCDYTFSDLGYIGNGLVHICHCVNCGAEVEYRIEIPKSEDCLELSEDDDGQLYISEVYNGY